MTLISSNNHIALSKAPVSRASETEAAPSSLRAITLPSPVLVALEKTRRVIINFLSELDHQEADIRIDLATAQQRFSKHRDDTLQQETRMLGTRQTDLAAVITNLNRFEAQLKKTEKETQEQLEMIEEDREAMYANLGTIDKIISQLPVKMHDQFTAFQKLSSSNSTAHPAARAMARQLKESPTEYLDSFEEMRTFSDLIKSETYTDFRTRFDAFVEQIPQEE